MNALFGVVSEAEWPGGLEGAVVSPGANDESGESPAFVGPLNAWYSQRSWHQ